MPVLSTQTHLFEAFLFTQHSGWHRTIAHGLDANCLALTFAHLNVEIVTFPYGWEQFDA